MLIDRGGDWKKKSHYDSFDKLKPGKESYFLSKYIPFILDIPTNNIHRIGGEVGEAEYNPCNKIQSNQTPMRTFNNIEIPIYSMLICPFRNVSPSCWYWVLISDCCGTNTRTNCVPWMATFWQGIGYCPHSGRVLVIDGEDLPPYVGLFNLRNHFCVVVQSV